MAQETDKKRGAQAVIPPGSTIGILGGGQLGRMLAMAAARLGYHCHIYSPEKHSPAAEVSLRYSCADYTDIDALQKFADSVDVITYEFENIPTSGLRGLSGGAAVFPGIDILETCQHRVREKTFLNDIGIKTAPFYHAKDAGDILDGAQMVGLPYILKTVELGYDGKGQVRVTSTDDRNALWKSLNVREAIIEGIVDFTMEISVIVARSQSGEVKCYPPVQNIHKHHILSETIAPAPIAPALSQKAEAMAKTIAEKLGLVGLLAVEMFVTTQGDILVNELAPRPHNSGHWTMDACATSQFEQAIRAVCGLPLGSTDKLCDAKMLNLIGDDINDWQKYMAMPDARLHLYGKKESRPGRKMGHVTFLSSLRGA